MVAGAIQVQFRRGTSTQMSAFVGAVGEIAVDLTSYRAVLHDGTTKGGWPQARAGLTKVSDANYTVQTTDVFVLFTKLTAGRTVTLPSVANYPIGQKLTIVDGTGTSSSNNITVVTANSGEKIAGSTTYTINQTSTASSWNHVSFMANPTTQLTSTGLTSTSNWVRIA